MSVFVDTGVFYAHHDLDASRHDVATEALTEVLRSADYGHVMTSDYVYDESVTLTYRRTGRMADAIELGRRVRGVDPFPDAIDILHASRPVFGEAVERFEQYADHGLSFTDAMTVALVEGHGIDAVLSFDDDFDGLVDRLAPATV
ncbi:VapC toxin family PIN domain ribonuclease [Halorubrum sp. 48-1-W]|uniref:type II toxin-antitoxin system VapC family toxin n=1 Tax=Halorubrum sp. 48-1-W TaxID=2249761 RepID=UPI000DCD1E3C|nr:PIN domain-containing protein [Halorubrum sp. 48-1-W]RAW46111.1 VapC toxin family PIN domain ribonuclease [Halorubrum sp. 48-1-W]